MDIEYSYSGQNISLIVGKIGANESELQNILCPSGQSLQHLQTLTAPHRRLEWLSARCLIKHLSPYEYEVVYDSNGKPVLQSQQYTLSISHSKTLAGVIIDGTKRSIGIDLEAISDRSVRVKHKFMSSSEDFFPDSEADLYCTLLWSAKEVMYKIMGNDYVDFKNLFKINPFRFSPQGGMLQALVSTPKRIEPICLHYKQIDDTILVWAAAN